MSRLVATSSTQSRARRPLPDGWHPQVVARGGVWEQWRVYDAAGNSFDHRIDVSWVLDQGGPLLGYTGGRTAHATELMRRVRKLTARGMYGPGAVASELEEEAAELLCDMVGARLVGGKKAQRVRWLANGSDACDCAIRLARAYTEREHFVSIGYHGSSVLFTHPPQRAGVPDWCYRGRVDVEFGDTQALAHAVNNYALAAIIVEVPPLDDDARSFLHEVRRLCSWNGALMILDEVVTGFRLALCGATELYDVLPDMACYGKALSNGRGISALVGREELMGLLEEEVFFSNTFNGDPYNCAHVIATLELLHEHHDDIYGHLWGLGNLLIAGLSERGVPCGGTAPRSVLLWPDKQRREFCAKLVPLGVMMDRPQYISMAHSTASLASTFAAIEKVMGE